MSQTTFSRQELTIPRKFLQRAPRTYPGERLYAIGDIHGRADLLVQMMRAIAEDKKQKDRASAPPVTRIVILGDFVDRGPQSRQIIEALQHFTLAQGLTVLMGNHEDAMLACLDGRADPHEGWLDFGGRETLSSFGINVGSTERSTKAAMALLRQELGENAINWLRALPLYAVSGDYLFVHAGVRPGIDLKRQSAQDILWIRDDFLHSAKAHSHFVIHGHSETQKISVRTNRIGIDTGAWQTGKLTCLCLEDDRAVELTVNGLARQSV